MNTEPSTPSGVPIRWLCSIRGSDPIIKTVVKAQFWADAREEGARVLGVAYTAVDCVRAPDKRRARA